MSTDDTLIEIRDLLGEIRDLLLPVADAHQDEYDRRQAERNTARIEAIKAAISSPQKKRVWQLARKELSQAQLAKASGMDSGNLSRFLRQLRQLGAISPEGTNPTRLIEVEL
jgi:hypothetical protein